MEVLLGIVHLAEIAPCCTGAAAICHLTLTLPLETQITCKGQCFFVFFERASKYFGYKVNFSSHSLCFERIQASLFLEFMDTWVT